MALRRVKVFIDIQGDPSVGIFRLRDEIELIWDLDEIEGDRERVRDVLGKCWAELYDDGGVSVHFDDECPDCLAVGYHKPSCPSEQSGIFNPL